MRNVEKDELIRRINRIPSDIFFTWSIAKLWRRYGYGFSYATFRNYLKVGRKRRREQIEKGE